MTRNKHGDVTNGSGADIEQGTVFTENRTLSKALGPFVDALIFLHLQKMNCRRNRISFDFFALLALQIIRDLLV